MAVLRRKVLECDVSILEFYRQRAFGFDDRGHRLGGIALAFECYDYALARSYVVEIFKTGDACRHRVIDAHLVDCFEAEVDEGVAGDHGSGRVEGLEKYGLVEGELQVGAQLFVEHIQRIGCPDGVHAVESLDSFESYPVLIGHRFIFSF